MSFRSVSSIKFGNPVLNSDEVTITATIVMTDGSTGELSATGNRETTAGNVRTMQGNLFRYAQDSADGQIEWPFPAKTSTDQVGQ